MVGPIVGVSTQPACDQAVVGRALHLPACDDSDRRKNDVPVSVGRGKACAAGLGKLALPEAVEQKPKQHTSYHDRIR